MNGVALYLQGFGTNRDIDIGWNQIQDQHGSRGIQVYGHADGDRIDDVRIHDNQVSGSELNNIVLGGSDGATEVLGTIHVFNNLIVGAGDSGLRINDPQGTVFIQNNVLYGNGTPGYSDRAQLYIQRAGTGAITLRNNIIVAGLDQSYSLSRPRPAPPLSPPATTWFSVPTLARPGCRLPQPGSALRGCRLDELQDPGAEPGDRCRR